MESIIKAAIARVEVGLGVYLGPYYDEFKRVMTECDGIISDFETRAAPIINRQCDYDDENCVDIYVDNQHKVKQLTKFFEYAGYKCIDMDYSTHVCKIDDPENLYFEIQIKSKKEVREELVNNECFGIMKNYLYFKHEMGFHIEHPDMVLKKTTDARVQTLDDILAVKFMKIYGVTITVSHTKMYIDFCTAIHNVPQPRKNTCKEQALTVLDVKLTDVRRYLDEQQTLSNKTCIGSLSGLINLLRSMKDKPDDLVALATQLSTQEPTTCYVYDRSNKDLYDDILSL